MSLSSFSLVIGVFFYVYGFPLVFSDETYVVWWKKLTKDQNMLRILATAFIAISVTTLRYHWRITPDGEGIIVTVAWIVFLKSIFVAWWPAMFVKLHGRSYDYLLAVPSLQAFAGFLMVLLGALFTYFGLILI